MHRLRFAAFFVLIAGAAAATVNDDKAIADAEARRLMAENSLRDIDAVDAARGA